MATFPEQLFQNHMINHPLLQYQMLFPSLLMSLKAPKASPDEDEGVVDPIDYLRFSALANQLAITQINQVLMDLVMESPGDDLKKLMEVQKTFMELIKKGFTQINQDMSESKTLITTNNQFMVKQDTTIATLQDVIAKGFINTISEVVDLQEANKKLANRTTSNAQESEKKMNNIASTLAKVQEDLDNMAGISLNYFKNITTDMELQRQTPVTDDSSSPTVILTKVQDDLHNLTKNLETFITEGANSLAESDAINNLIEKCSNASIAGSSIDFDNITQKIEEALASNLKKIQTHVKNISQDLGEVDSTFVQTQESLNDLRLDLSLDINKNEGDIRNLKRLTEAGFVELNTKIDILLNASLSAAEDKVVCPDKFFSVEKECFYLSEGIILTFEEAEEDCQRRDAHLAEPDALMEFLAVIKRTNSSRPL